MLRKWIAKSKSKDTSNRKGIRTVAIVHVVMKSSSTAPPSAAHAQYIARDGQYESRGGLELVEFGNMPEFAQADPYSFWVAADEYERKNGRAYTELQIALPRELNPEQRNELAREATRELLDERFAYTLAVHTPLAKDNIEQPHMHLMFSERVVDSNTQSMPEEQFFKRNGAKKDRSWNDKDKPMEVREKWVGMMNAAMERQGQEQRLDSRSWANQGREDLAALREEKTLRGDGPEAMKRHEKIAEQRQQRAELPAPHLDQAAAAIRIEREAEKAIRKIERWRDEQLGRLEQAIDKAKELAEAARAFVQRSVETLRDRVQGTDSKEVQAQKSPPSLAVEKASLSQVNPADELARQLEQFRAAGRQGRAQRDLKVEAAKPVIEPQQELQRSPKKEKEIEIKGHGHGFGL